MPADALVATAVALVFAAIALLRAPRSEDWSGRLLALGLAYALVLGWRLVARMPVFGIVELRALDYKTADQRIPTAVIVRVVFLLFAYGAAFK